MNAVDQLPSRIRAKIVFRDAPVDRPVTGQCWIWTGGKTSAGYGMTTWFDGEKQYLHRIAYTVYVEEIPAGLHIDHRCRVVACCNPDHLDAVTPRVNVLRGLKATKTECVNRHPLSGENLVWSKDANGYRHRRCRTCYYASHRESHERHGEKWNATRRAKYQPRRDPALCGNGHEWADGNERVGPSGVRICRQCERDRKRRYQEGCGRRAVAALRAARQQAAA